MRVRRYILIHKKKPVYVSIHAPVRVRLWYAKGKFSVPVSIHAPVRVRLLYKTHPSTSSMFQFTHP